MSVTIKPNSRSATLVVVASNSKTISKKSADYLCDGTADDVQIQAAITALSSTGGKIVLSEGTFNIATTPLISSNNLIIEGQGKGTILKSVASSSVNCIGLSQANRIVIRNLQIDGNKSNQSGSISYTVNAGIHISRCDDVLVENCYVHDTYMQGIYMEDSTNLIINKNRVYNTGDGGIFTHPRGNNPACSNVIISNNIVDSSGYYGITAIRSDYVSMVGNISSNNGLTDPSQGFGLDMEGCRYSLMSNNIAFGGHGGILVRITTEGGSDRRCLKVAIQGNTCYNNTTSGTHGEASIQLEDSDDILIQGNNVSTSTQGINIGNATYVIVNGNISTGHTNSGIRCYSTSGSHINISGNYCQGNGNHGVETCVSRTMVVGNTLEGNTGCGINLTSGSSNTTIRDNQIYDNTDNGILVNDSGSIANIDIINNEFDNTSTTQGRALYEAGSGGPTRFLNNRCKNQSNEDFHLSHTSSIASGNDNTVTFDHKSGTASITTGNTSTTVNHGIYTTPTDIIITPTSSLGLAASWYITSIGSTQFTINLNVNPAGTVSFSWQAVVK